MGDEKDKPDFDINDHAFDAFRFGMGLGSGPEFMDSLRQAVQNGIIGGAPPGFYEPGGIRITPPQQMPPRPRKDVAEEKIAELERRLQLEAMERKRIDLKLEAAKMKIRRLEQDNQNLAMEKLQSLGGTSFQGVVGGHQWVTFTPLPLWTSAW